MGMFDEFVGTCPACGGRTMTQCKRGPCYLRQFSVGDDTGEARLDGIIDNGSCCGEGTRNHESESYAHCGATLRYRFRKGVFLGFVLGGEGDEPDQDPFDPDDGIALAEWVLMIEPVMRIPDRILDAAKRIKGEK